VDLSTVTMDRKEARKAFLDYRSAVRQRHSEEDAALMQGYRQLALGRQLISLSDTLSRAGTVDSEPFTDTWYRTVRTGTYSTSSGWHTGERVCKLPAFAVMRADQTECWVETFADGSAVFTPRYEYRGRRDRVALGRDTFDGLIHAQRFRAMVPPVPPALRPRRHLRNYHILWEADWVRAVPPRPPGDPALLKRIGGDLYAVLATWDLTELERLVLLGGRRP
jgi:hypothetical protein